jgi:hypothetical protein
MTGPVVQHPYDMPEAILQSATAASDRPDILRQLVAISRETFGYYANHYAHTINHVWAATRLSSLCPGARVLDIGAGLSSLPIWLASRGLQVDCVDGSPMIRTSPAAPDWLDWDEWGFFDYATLGPNLSAHHCEIGAFNPPNTYDAIYSMGSLAAMHSTDWQWALASSRTWLNAGGILLLAVGLLRGTYSMWNFGYGVEAEPVATHGKVCDIEHHLVKSGFSVREMRLLRNVMNSRTDLLFIECAA